MAKDIIATVEGSKIWGYVAMGAGALAVVGIAVLVKEELEARKASNILKIAEAGLDSVKKGVESGAEVISGGVKKVLGGKNSDESGFAGFKDMRTPVKGFVSSYRPLRQTYQESPTGGAVSKRTYYCDGKLMADNESCHNVLTWTE